MHDPIDLLLEDYYLILSNEPECEICGCTDDNACDNCCSWSQRYLKQERWICTNCEAVEIMREINMGALRILMDAQQINFCSFREREIQTDKFDSWAIVEIFGHQKFAGRVIEQAIGGVNNPFVMWKVGKKASGRLLDSRERLEFPWVQC